LFKLLGLFAGYYFFGFFGAIIGFMLGGSLDRYLALGAGAINPLGNARRQLIFVETVFTLMGKLAKADGHISQDEIAFTEEFMQKLGMSAEHKQQAIVLFKKGAAGNFDITPQLNEFMAVCGNTNNLKQMLMVYLIVMAMADGQMHASEDSLLKKIATHLGYDQIAYQQLMEMVLNQTHFAGGQQASTAARIEDAYKALGVSKESSDQEVKRAYRKLISQYHPDKLIGQGLPEDMIALATKQAQEVQIAYDLIKESREPKMN
jgi:DnaJ like chaperone protein